MATWSRFLALLFPPPPAREPPGSALAQRIGVWVLAVEWVLFGSMHFSAHDLTLQQVPCWVPAQDLVVTLTGMAEVTTGMLILLVPATRRLAATASLALLVLFLPSMVQILSVGAALPKDWWPAARIAFRVGLLPNNLYLAVLSVRLWLHPWPIIAPARRSPATPSEQPPVAISFGDLRLWVAFLLLMANTAGFVAILGGAPGYSAQASLWAMMCIASGALLGFLFAVPRLNSRARSKAALLPNTNIETVSDWITKIIVGVGLINFKEIGAFLTATAHDLGASIHAGDAFALSLIVYFFMVGMIQGYILTRVFLNWEFSKELNAEE